MFEYVGNLHVHSTYSDGTLSIEEIAVAAQKAGIDFVGINDHHHLQGLKEGKEGWYDERVLILIGTEVNHTQHHFLAYDVTEEIPANDTTPQAVIDACNRQGGIGFIAHPFEKGCPLGGGVYPWKDWSVTGYTGISIWNFCSMWKEKVYTILHGLYYYCYPLAAVQRACPEAIARWDQECQRRKVVAIGGSDAHGFRYRKGPLSLTLFPYPFLFRTVNVHILTPTPFTRTLAQDRT
ncbi:MAG: PHP domain-containing protein, partial [Nitrospinota bacterium]